MRIHFKSVFAIVTSLILTAILFDDINRTVNDIGTQIYYYMHPEKSIYCYEGGDSNLPKLMDMDVRKGKSIFLHETSCRSAENGKITILPRQACAVESAARLNPNLDVYLSFSSSGDLKSEGSQSDRMLLKLLEYPNLKIVHLDYANYTKNTPLQNIYSKGYLAKSSYAQSHASDILRYLTLYKYGGIYLDMDVVVIKSLENLSPNYAGIESIRNVAAGVLSLDYTGVGHDHAKNCVFDLMDNFDRHSWGENGPGVITRLLRKLCNVQLGKDMVQKACGNFTVYPPYMFYPIPWGDWKMYFEPNKSSEVSKLTKDSYVLHVWNKHSEQELISKNSQAPYTEYAREYCPKIFKECDNYF